MAVPEERIARLEAEVERLRPTLHERLARLEAAAAKPPATGFARFLAWMGPELPKLLGAAVLVLIAWWVKDSVDLAVKQQQLQLSYVKEMKAELDAMAKPNASDKDIERAAIVVSAFGEPAVLPLLNELRFGGNRALGAQSGLRWLAFMHPATVCEAVERAMSSPARVFAWEAQMLSAGILAAANCRSALPLLREQARALAAVRAGSAQEMPGVAEKMPGVPQLKAWERVLEESIAALQASQARAP
jgi:hypothetical protein